MGDMGVGSFSVSAGPPALSPFYLSPKKGFPRPVSPGRLLRPPAATLCHWSWLTRTLGAGGLCPAGLVVYRAATSVCSLYLRGVVMATMLDGESYVGRVLVRPVSPARDVTLYCWPLRCLKGKFGGTTFGLDVK